MIAENKNKKSHVLVVLGGQHFQGVGVELNCFQGESEPPVTPTSSPGPCMTDPSQNDRVSCLNHEYCTDFPIAKITYSTAKMLAFL